MNMVATPDPLVDLARWVATREPRETRPAARRLLMDQIGISHAGLRLMGRHASTRLLDMDGSPRATCWAEARTGLAPYVALANRCAGDELELAAGPECVAAAVAAAEIGGASLGDLLDALSVGADVDEYLRGWLGEAAERHAVHPPAFFGAMVSAAVAARLLGLAPEGCRDAIATAAALAPQSSYAAFSGGGSAKTLYGGWSQSLGLQAALWADHGIAGARSVLAGSRGIAHALLDARDGVVPPPFDPDGQAIARVTFKAYPCNRASHAALTAIDALLASAPAADPLGSVETLDAIDILTYPYAVSLDRRSRGPSPIAAQVSIRATIALRVALGHLEPGRAYTTENLARPVVRALHDKITVGLLPGTEAGPRRRVARVTIRTRDGRERTQESEARWHAGQPATDAELRARFDAFTQGTRSAAWWDTPDERPVREMVRL